MLWSPRGKYRRVLSTISPKRVLFTLQVPIHDVRRDWSQSRNRKARSRDLHSEIAKLKFLTKSSPNRRRL